MWILIFVLCISTVATRSIESEQPKQANSMQIHYKFLDGVSSEDRVSFYDIVLNDKVPRSEIKKQLREWGRNNNLEDEVIAHEAERKAFFIDHQEKVDDAVQKLPETLIKMRSYLRDDTLSHGTRSKLLHRLFKNMTPELRALVIASKPANVKKLADAPHFDFHRRLQALRDVEAASNIV